MDGESLRRAKRRRKLLQLLEEVGKAAAGADVSNPVARGATQAEIDTGTPRTHFVAMATGRRGLGDALAARLETHYRKAPGWFDQELAWPFSEELHPKVLALPNEELLKAENILRGFVGLPQQKEADLATRVRVIDRESAKADDTDATEDDAALKEHELPASKSHERQKHRRPAREKGGSGG